MTTLKIGVVEDELIIARTILGTLDELGYGYCGPAINYTEAMEMLDRDKPDLLLLDIQLSGKKDGIDVARRLNEQYHLPFIFLTANSDGETIERAKAVKPPAYIVKPFTKEELFAAIEIAFSNFSGNGGSGSNSGGNGGGAGRGSNNGGNGGANSNGSGGASSSAGRGGNDPKHQGAYRTRDYMFVRDGYVFRKIAFSELLYLESDANYVALHLLSQKKIMVRSTLNDFVTQLDLSTFVRVHRSYSVNIHLIDDISPVEVSMNGVKVPVGKSYREDLLKALGIHET
jgi:DNA-binding LytR/AlgR family response regulator